MVSADELRNVGMCALVSALVLTSANAATASAIVAETERAALARLNAEGLLGEAALRAGSSLAQERDILETWAAWYRDAIATVSDVEPGVASPSVQRDIARASDRVREALQSILAQRLGVRP